MSPGESEPQFGYEDHFTPARTRKKRKNRPPAESPSPTLLLERASEELARIDWLRDAQQALRETLQEAFAFNAGAAPDVLCLGLGSPSSSRDARAQLAFLLAVCDDLRIARTNVSIFDPVFTEQDHQLLTQLGLTELPENRMAHHRLESPTIAFMPHCDLHLYDNLFRENWSREQLPRVLLIANRLSEYAENIPSRKLAAEFPCVARLECIAHFDRVRRAALASPPPLRRSLAVASATAMDGVATLGPPTPLSRSLAPAFAPTPAHITVSMLHSPFLATGSLAYPAAHPCRPFPSSFTRAIATRAPLSHAPTLLTPAAAHCLASRPLQPCAAFPTAFNNTAVQFVRAAVLADAEHGDDWWTLPPPTAVATAPSDHETTTTGGETSSRYSSSTGSSDKVQPEPGQLPREAGSIGGNPTSAPRSAKPTLETPSSS